MTSSTPTLKDVEKATIDGIKATDWIQNKATKYCTDLVTVEREFEKIGGELTEEEVDAINDSVATAVENKLLTENGIGEDSLRTIAESTYKSDHIFNYYYGTEGERGMSEEDLKEYFDNNFARVKCVSMSYLDSEGNKLDESGKKEIREMADKYAENINKKTNIQDKLAEVDKSIDDYNEYVEEQNAAAAEDDAAVTTTTASATTTAETTTTTTTDPHANERIIQKATTTTADSTSEAETVTTTTKSASQKSSENLNKYIFDELSDYDKAVVFDDEANDAIYVVMRTDLKERLNSDDLWTDDNIRYIQSLNFNTAFSDYMKGISDSYTAEKNKKAYSRYKPFKLVLEESDLK